MIGLSSRRTLLLTKDKRVDPGQPHQVLKPAGGRRGNRRAGGTGGTPHAGAGLGRLERSHRELG